MRSRFLFSAVALVAFAAPGYAYRMTAWVPSWDPNAVTIMQMQAGNLQETNPGWYQVLADGSLALNYKAEDPTMRAALTGTQLVPTVKNNNGGRFNGPLVATIVADPALREKHAETLAQLVVTKGYDGIDIDYEAVPATAKADFSTFIEILAEKLHASNRLLSVTVHAKTTDTNTRNGPGSQDWRAIGAVADSVKIMAYDKHWDGSVAGAVTPLDWLGQVAAYAQTTLPPGKAILGLPWYGYDWLGTDATTVTHAQAVATAQSKGVTINRDATGGEATYTYEGRTVYFQDAEAYRRKVELIKSSYPGIAGFAAWRVGAEDPAIWTVVGQLGAQSDRGAPVTSAPKDFALTGPGELAVTAGEETFGTYGYTGINGFTTTVTATVSIVDPFGGTVRLTTPAVTPTAPTSLTVSVPRTTAAGTYRLVVRMSGGGVTHEKIVSLHVSAAPATRRRSVR